MIDERIIERNKGECVLTAANEQSFCEVNSTVGDHSLQKMNVCFGKPG